MSKREINDWNDFLKIIKQSCYNSSLAKKYGSQTLTEGIAISTAVEQNKLYIRLENFIFNIDIDLSQLSPHVFLFKSCEFNSVITYNSLNIQCRAMLGFQSCIFNKIIYQEQHFQQFLFSNIISFTSCTFNDFVDFFYCTFTKGICIDKCKFKKRISFSLCIFQGRSIVAQTDFEDDCLLGYSKLHGEIAFNECSFLSLADFESINSQPKSVSDNTLVGKKEGKVIFASCDFNDLCSMRFSYLEYFDIDDCEFSKSYNLPNPDHVAQWGRSYLRLAKHQKIQEHDQISALDIYAKEMSVHAVEVKQAKNNLGDRILLFFSSLTDYGLNWIKGIGILTLYVFVLSILGAPILQPLNNWTSYGKGIITIALKLLYPPSLFSEWNISLANLSPWLVAKGFFKLFWSAFYGAMIYQIIRAFRKYSRSLE